MTIDLEADLRREFDAASAPSSLTFSPEVILRQGGRTVRRRRIVAAGSCAVAVAVVATGGTLLARPHRAASPSRRSTRRAPASSGPTWTPPFPRQPTSRSTATPGSR